MKQGLYKAAARHFLGSSVGFDGSLFETFSNRTRSTSLEYEHAGCHDSTVLRPTVHGNMFFIEGMQYLVLGVCIGVAYCITVRKIYV